MNTFIALMLRYLRGNKRCRTLSYFCSCALLGLICCSATFVTSCTSEIVGVEFPHEERIVINGFLEPGVPVRNIMVLRTLPATDTLDMTKSRVTDAEVSITTDGQIYPLTLQPDSLALQGTNAGAGINLAEQPTYYRAEGLIPQTGKTYTLTVKHNGKQATATTFIPEEPRIVTGTPSVITRLDSIPLYGGGASRFHYILHGSLSLHTDALSKTYIGMTELQPLDSRTKKVIDQERLYSPVSPQLIAENTAIAGNRTEVKTIFRTLMFAEVGKLGIRLQLISYDDQYYRFLTTSDRGTSASAGGLFNSGGDSPQWNVIGDGVGLFIGRSKPVAIDVLP